MTVPTHRRRTLLAAAILGLALLAAGCGASPKNDASTGDNPASQSGQAPGTQAEKYAACMRAHGITNFPDPVVHTSTGGGATAVSVGIRVTPAIVSMPGFKAAQTACASILPALKNGGPGQTPAQQQAKVDDEISFARCVRAHGVANFPDPNGQGQLTLPMLQAAGVNLRSPAFASAGSACLSAAGGLISKAELQQAESGNAASGSQSAGAGQ